MHFFGKRAKKGQKMLKRAKYLKIWAKCTKFENVLKNAINCKKRPCYILIFCLSHGQSAVECGFSANKEYIKESQSENCLVSLRIIHSHLTFKKVAASSITITVLD